MPPCQPLCRFSLEEARHQYKGHQRQRTRHRGSGADCLLVCRIVQRFFCLSPSSSAQPIDSIDIGNQKVMSTQGNYMRPISGAWVHRPPWTQATGSGNRQVCHTFKKHQLLRFSTVNLRPRVAPLFVRDGTPQSPHPPPQTPEVAWFGLVRPCLGSRLVGPWPVLPVVKDVKEGH